MPLPTLLQKNTFRFDDKVELIPELETLLNNNTSIDIILKIIEKKINLTKMNNKMYFLQGRTGSGKSTLMISSLYNKFVKNTIYKLICSEPTVVLTKTNALELTRYDKNLVIGKNIGILTGPEKIYTENKDSLFYCTPQILSNILLSKLLDTDTKFFFQYNIVIIDEVHVLDLPMLTLLYNINIFVNKYENESKCPIFIFSSATIDINAMINYYFPLIQDRIYKDYKMIGYVEGIPNNKVDEIFIDEISMKNYINEEYHNKSAYIIMANYYLKNYLHLERNNNYISVTEKRIKNIKNNWSDKILNAVNSYMNNDVLVFLPVVSGIIQMGMYIEKICNENNIPTLFVNKLMPWENVVNWRNNNRNRNRILIISFARDFSPAADIIMSTAKESDIEAIKFEKKIIISTPIIETGKTISSLTLCIDMGLQTTNIYNPLVYIPNQMENIKQIPANKSQITQRLGRVGREQAGTFIHFYTIGAYEKFMNNSMPATINSYCLSFLLLDNIQLMEKWVVNDLMNQNKYLYKISTDILLRSINDLIDAGYYSIFGEIVEYKYSYKNSSKWLLYAQYLFYELNYSLFESLIIVFANEYSLPDILYPKDFNPENLQIKLQDIKERKNINDNIINAIVKARNYITEIKYSKNNNTFPNIQNRLF